MKKLTLLGFICAFAVLANAGDLKFMASEQVSYDDNIYLTNKNTKDSFISSTKIGAKYEGKVPNTSLKGLFSAVGGYNAYTEDNSKNGYWDALAIAEVSNKYFTLGDRFLLTSDPANSEQTERAKRINNDAYANFITSKEKMFSLGVKISDNYNRYFKDEFKGLNRNRINAGVGAYYNISSKTSLFAEYTYTDIDYDKNKNNNSDGGIVALGVEGQIASKVKGTAKATYNYRNYDHDLAGYDSYADLFGYEVALAWQPTSRTLFRLSGDRTFEETLYENNRYFVSTGVNLYASQKINKFTLGLNLGYDNLSYQTANLSNIKRKDDVYTIRPEVDYQFKEWLSAGVWYQYRKRASNAADNYEYDNNRVGAFIKAIF